MYPFIFHFNFIATVALLFPRFFFNTLFCDDRRYENSLFRYLYVWNTCKLAIHRCWYYLKKKIKMKRNDMADKSIVSNVNYDNATSMSAMPIKHKNRFKKSWILFLIILHETVKWKWEKERQYCGKKRAKQSNNCMNNWNAIWKMQTSNKQHKQSKTTEWQMNFSTSNNKKLWWQNIIKTNLKSQSKHDRGETGKYYACSSVCWQAMKNVDK